MIHGFARRRRDRYRCLFGSRFAAASVVVGLVLLGTTASASQAIPEAGGCPVVAGAQGLQLMGSASDNLFLAAPTGAGVPVAQSCVDVRIASSTGYASSPYPGDTVLSLVGEAKFPGYASSQYPADPRSKADGPGFSMTSTSKEHSSKATARAGLVEQPAHAASTVASAQSLVDPRTGAATATATSDTQPLTINDVLELGRIRSSATATIADGGELHRDSVLQVGRTTIAGQEAQISPDGVEAVEAKVGIPDVNPNDVLAKAGIEVRFIGEEKTSQGVVSAGIEIIARQTNPDSGAEYVVHYTFGRAFASAKAVEPQPGLAGLSPPAPADTDEPALNQGSAESAGTGSVSGGGPAPVPDVPPGDGEAPPQAALAAPVQPVSSPVDIGATTLYLVLAFCGLVLFASGTLLRLLGVKTR
jgi:hypothetical protein